MDTNLFTFNKQQNPLFTYLYDMFKMILTCSIIIILIIYIMRKNGDQKNIKKPMKEMVSREQNQIQNYQIQYYKPKEKKYRNSTSRFSFNQESFSDQQDEIMSMVEGYKRQEIYPETTYSFKQSKKKFLSNLKALQPESMIYFDKNDQKQRENMLKHIEQKKRQQLNQIIVQNAAQKKKQQKKQEKQVEKKTVPQQVQAKSQKKTTIGQKQIFADNKEKKIEEKKPSPPIEVPKQKIQIPAVEKSKTIDFSGINLGGLKAENKMGTTQTKPNISETKPNKTPSLFPNLPTAQLGEPKKPETQQTSLFSNKQTISAPQNAQQIPIFSKLQEKKPQQVIKKQQTASIKTTPSPVFPVSQNNITSVNNNITSQNTVSNNAAQNQIKNNKKAYLQKFIDFGNKAVESCELPKTKPNNFGRSISNLKELYETTVDFINTINVGNAKQVQTLACKIFDFLLNKNIPSWPKQQGWQKFPPRGKQGTMWKISINTYVMKLNLYRVMGYQKIWLIVFGKLLNLLDFTWKRQTIIKSQKQLDLIKKGYFNIKGQDQMAAKYFTRLDLITYFLFCMTTFDPQLFTQYLCQTAKQDQSVYEQIKKYKYKWNYNYFWILTDNILANKTKTYFKPILYMNMLSSIYLQLRKHKINSSEFTQFEHLKKYLLKEAYEYTKSSSLESNEQVQALGKIDVQARAYKFDGQDFTDQLQTLNFYFKEKQTQYKLGLQQFQKKCSNFDYFKSQGSIV